MPTLQAFSPPPVYHPGDRIITPWSYEALGVELEGLGTPISAAWQSSARALYVPFVVVEPITIVKVFWINGATVTGTNNVDIGVYAEDATNLFTTGNTAQSGANISGVVQVVDITDYTITAPGRYYMAMAVTVGTTATFFQSLTVATAPAFAQMGVMQQASASPLPTPSATFATASQTIMPIFGLSLKTEIA